MDYIKKMSYTRGTTNTASALDMATNRIFSGDRANVPNIAIVFTDGGSNDKEATIASAQAAKKKMTVVAIGIGGWTDEYELKAIASDPYSVNYWKIRRFDDLKMEEFRTRLRNFICNSK